jgi:peptide/nickel transport system substrate-binding protein
MNFLAFNFKNKILSIKKVRQAIAFGFQRDNVLKRIYQGNGELLSGPFFKGSRYNLRELKPYVFSITTAKRLLDEAGFKSNGNGQPRINSKGEKLEFNVLVPKYEGENTIRRVIDQFITDMQLIGIKINRIDMQWQNYLKALKYDKNFDIAWGNITMSDDSAIFNVFHSKNILLGGNNFISYKNLKVDKLINQLWSADDENEINILGKRFHTIMHDELPFLFLWNLKDIAAARSKIWGIKFYTAPYSFFDYMNHWSIEE